MSSNIDSLVLSQLNSHNNESASLLFEHALVDIDETFQSDPIAKIPFNEIATLGGPFAVMANAIATPATGDVYRCVFPKGVTGKLAETAKNGVKGNLGNIMNNGKIVGQARWQPVEAGFSPAYLQTALVAVAVIAVVKQLSDIKEGQKDIIGILERDKKSQLLADYDLLTSYMEDYKYYWENETTVTVNLNQVKNIKRNAQKDIRSYSEQIEKCLGEKTNLLKPQLSSQTIGKILNRFVHYKLALHVYALSEYLEVMLSKNFQTEYLNKIMDEMRQSDFCFRELYSKCFDKIEEIKKEAVSTKAVNKASIISKNIGTFINKVPLLEKGSVDEFLVSLSDTLDKAESKKLKETLDFFIQYKESGLTHIIEHIQTIDCLSNKPVIMLYNDNVLCFESIQEVC